ncbi:cyclase family protein [Spirosoma foliorum]|uniref:Cyclase family protein n=1 Tax=Spirosoma foliorum TaxID=2710596 RepID=A0A7G5H1I9_9BACT|nr:cyclase family protein [Spirosoma foliorum]
MNRFEISEHTSTHVDGLNHIGITYKGQFIDTMHFSLFYTEGICLGFSHQG